MSDLIQWLLDDQNPAVQFRTRTELLGQATDPAQVQAWILSKLPGNWQEIKGLWYRYYVTALAECGLTYDLVPEGCLDRAFQELDEAFECSCADFMLLASLVRLGLARHDTIQNILTNLNAHQLPDGGFVCTRRRSKISYTPKSCYKANLHALIFAAACKKQGVNTPFSDALADYFLRRNLFYRSDDPNTLVLDGREGWRSIDTFHPSEVMRVGIHSIVEAFAALGYGGHPAIQSAMTLLNQQKDDHGRVILNGTLTKSYLPKERTGMPSRWVTFYTMLAEKEISFQK